ncbi:acetyl-CoA acetyltransferase [Zobellella denitrificans]|uniref:Acetyl-CoA acetyltransferase n=1 Tax=Zobellella denitrificans TaxID=347534 RepID=A0A291HSL2_9GAMM|nr:acetyl-CoA C-acyltransferase [Zobellella denitrificans]ATG75135.1 acetyl-CoA acetyltransferase [Zobellella denitrificans]
MAKSEIVIVGAARTPMGALLGDFGAVPAPGLGAVAIKAALGRAGVAAERVDEVVMGCVLAAGQGQAPARQAALGAGLPVSVGCTTVNKMCGSGMKALMLAHDQLLAGSARLMVAGGMESMSLAPYLLPKARAGLRMGHGQLLDHMFFDGLEDAYEGGLMGSFAQRTADKFGIGREAMDDFAIRSLTRAQLAIAEGDFAEEIVPVEVAERQGSRRVDTDEQPGKARPDKIRTLKPAFAQDGTITAANSSSISDGAAALVVTTAEQVAALGLRPLARVLGHATHAQLPAEFTLAPIGAIDKLLDRLGWQASEVDLFEINEAFAVVALLAIRELGLDPARVNVNGGACALGHPIGASGARIVVTLLHALRRRGRRRGVAALCIGGGEATAVAVELL